MHQIQQVGIGHAGAEIVRTGQPLAVLKLVQRQIARGGSINRAVNGDWNYGEDENQTGDDSYARNTFYNANNDFRFGSD